MTQAQLKHFLQSPQVSPFLVLGDPTPELSIELAKTAVSSGAGMLEIGFPYSDPVADGPSIQAADMRALKAGTSTSKAMSVLHRIHEACPKTPLNLLVYGNLVHKRGFEQFCNEVAEAGASSLLVPDICLEESILLKRSCRAAGIGHVQLIGPLTSKERLKRIDNAATSFVYLVAHQGVTGVRSGNFTAVENLVGRTASQLNQPLCVGFGLSKPKHIQQVFAAGAKLAVVGSFLANVIGESKKNQVITNFSRAFRPLVAAR